MNKVNVEKNGEHVITGYVMSCEDTCRTIASFWHDYDAEDVAKKVNNHDQLIAALDSAIHAINAAAIMMDGAEGKVMRKRADELKAVLRQASQLNSDDNV